MKVKYRSSITSPLLQVKAAMLKKHRHQFEGMKKAHPENGIGSDMSKLPLIRSLADIGRTHSSAKSKALESKSYFEQRFPPFDSDEANQNSEHIYGAYLYCLI